MAGIKSPAFVVIVAVLLLFGPASVLPGGTGSAYAQSTHSTAMKVKRLAERGDINAQAELGLLYSKGRGVPQNYHLAAMWYRRAAERGHGGAQLALGLLYNRGEGVPKNFMLAYMWIDLSAAQAAGEIRDFKVRLRDSIASKLTPNQLEEAQQLASTRYKLR
jgi:TPR repeat protein